MLEGRIVATFRAAAVQTAGGRSFLDRAQALVARVAAIGAVHVGWDALSLTFVTDTATLPLMLDAAAPEHEPDAWAVGLASGDLGRVAGAGSPLLESGLLWWGLPIVTAAALARAARPGEVLCDERVPPLRDGLFATWGRRVVREGDLRLRGVRIDARQPWRATASLNLARMTEPPLLRGHAPGVGPLPGALIVVRADPGEGGTRVLLDIGARAARVLRVGPAGAGVEPLGALRRAVERAVGSEVQPLVLELTSVLDALLAGDGATAEMATRLVTALLWPRQASDRSAIVVDDTKAVDPASLEACARAVRHSTSFGLVVRLDRAAGLPSALAGLPLARELFVPPLSTDDAEAIAAGCTGGALDAVARRRWARLGGKSPLAVVEAVAHGISSGAIVWSGARARPRSRVAGRGPACPAEKWIRVRASAETGSATALLSLLAVLGGEAREGLLARVFEHTGLALDVEETVTRLERARWIVVVSDARAGEPRSNRRVAFPSRTHQAALFGALDEPTRKRLHAAVARVLFADEGVFGRVEAAWHSAQAGEWDVASAALREAAQAAAEAGLDSSTRYLRGVADRRTSGGDEHVPDAARARGGSVYPPFVRQAQPSASSPPISLPLGAAGVSAPPPPRLPSIPNEEPEDLEEPDSLVEHARIVVPSSNQAVSPHAPAPRDADELRELRLMRSEIDPADHRGRCEASLALAAGLEAAARADEALLEGLDALARARQLKDAGLERACLVFLAELYGSVGRHTDAERLLAVTG